MNGLAEVSVLGVGGNECNEADLTTEGEELGNFTDSSDVLGSVFSCEAQVFVKTTSDHISIEDKYLLSISKHTV